MSNNFFFYTSLCHEQFFFFYKQIIFSYFSSKTKSKQNPKPNLSPTVCTQRVIPARWNKQKDKLFMRLNHTLIPHISRQTGGPTLGKTRCVKNYTLWLERKKKRKNGRGVGKIRKNKFITNNNRNRFIFFVNSNLQASLAWTCFEKNDITLCRWLWFCAKFTTDRQYVWENGLEWVGLFFPILPQTPLYS